LFTTQNKHVTVSVINDLSSDNRVKKTCNELVAMGFKVTLVGRELPSSSPIKNWNFETKRMKLLFKKGVLFYTFFNTRLFFYLLFKKSDVLYANDLDTLLPNYLVSKLKGSKLIYDSHEIFCEVPELQQTPFKKKIWERLERSIVPKLKYCITVNQSIANYFKEKYGTEFKVVRNIPAEANGQPIKERSELGVKPGAKMIVLQGAGINIQRGAEELVLAMNFVEGAQLFIIGGGDVWSKLEQLVKENKLEDKVKLIKKIPKEELVNYTFNADLGISIDKNTNLNYSYSLPNKVFDYIQAEVPILASKLVEIEALISKYNIGAFIVDHEPKHIAERIGWMLHSTDYELWKRNLKQAKKELTWEEEKKVLINLVHSMN
jgi:glycosyltransferase involved in cell wall biosynthesis